MNKLIVVLSASVLLCGALSAIAQQPSPASEPADGAPTAPRKATAQSEAGEPRAATSQPAVTTTAPSQSGTSQAGVSQPATAKRNAAVAGQRNSNAADKLELGTATVTGDREQPKVMYIVPWKRSDIGDLEGKPMNSLVDEILSPVDRDVFRREVRYYQTVKSNAPQNEAASNGQGEK